MNRKEILRKLGNYIGMGRRPKQRTENIYKGTSKATNRKGSGSEVRTIANLEKYEKAYATEGLVFAAINTIANYVIYAGFEIHCDNQDIKKEIDKFLSKNNFINLIADATRQILIYGDAFIENVKSKDGSLVELRLVNPKNLTIDYDERGDALGYIQTINDTEIYFKPDEITHFQLYSIPSSVYGVSMIGANYDSIVRKVKTDDGIGAAIERHGFPKYHVRVGNASEGVIPPSDVITDIAEDFENINAKNEFVTTDLIDIRPIDYRGIEHIEEYFEYFLSLLSSGFMVPEIIMGLGKNITEASSKVKMQAFERSIIAYQKRLSYQVEKDIFSKITDERVELRWNDISPQDEVDKAKWVRELILPNDPYGILTKDEIRKIFNYPEMEKAEEVEKADKYGLPYSPSLRGDVQEIVKDYRDRFKEIMERSLK
jgi:hypothetical protein